jgi:large subunit ribosomal protein L30
VSLTSLGKKVKRRQPPVIPSPTTYIHFTAFKSKSRHLNCPSIILISTSEMPFFRITLLRSGIGLPMKTRGVLTALGLRKRMATVFQPVTPDVAGMIMKVKELVDVEEVEEKLTKYQIKANRKPDPGFYVEGKAPRSFV